MLSVKQRACFSIRVLNLSKILLDVSRNSLSYSTILSSPEKIGIVGSGPAALYTAQYVLKHLPKEKQPVIDIYEKLPVPFGLVRYGVAPDHQDVKNVINSFTETLKQENVNFFGNVNIGTDLGIGELINLYDCVVLAYGANGEKYLNIPGEKVWNNLISAKEFVSMYNGLPSEHKMHIDLSGRKAIIIGAGNVAIDIARILLSPTKKLAKTDISSQALELIEKTNKIEHVAIVARRGILNAAFTLKELRELTKIESLVCKIDVKQFEDIRVERILGKLARPRKRIIEYMYNLAKESTNFTGNKKIISLEFLKTPLEILGNNLTKQVTGVRFGLNRYDVDFERADLKLDSEEALNSLPVVSTGEVKTDATDLVVRSIGYQNVNIDSTDIPFDKKLGVVLNDRGKVLHREGLYCTGWIKRGPRGVIVDTTSDAFETAQQICSDLLKRTQDNEKPGSKRVVEILRERNVRFVDKHGWHKIDNEEKRRGKEVGKPREKFNSIDEMIKVAYSET
jgi:adrenodoxin-NADP+ reductase